MIKNCAIILRPELSSYRFSDTERYAVYSVHGPSCYIGGSPLTLSTMHVDHVIPEKLLSDTGKLAKALKDLGLPADFQINSYENWMPSCAPCNLAKSGTVFNPSLKVQLALQKAAKHAESARILASEIVTKRKLSRALNTIMRAEDLSLIDRETIRTVAERLNFDLSDTSSEPTLNPVTEDDLSGGRILRLTPLHEVIFESGAMRMVKAPYGIGFQPTDPNPHSSFICGHCSHPGPWQGARCMTCGYLDDGD